MTLTHRSGLGGLLTVVLALIAPAAIDPWVGNTADIMLGVGRRLH